MLSNEAEQTASGLYISRNDTPENSQQATVLNVGDKVERGFKAGDIIVYDPYGCVFMDIFEGTVQSVKKPCVFIPEQRIIGVVQKDEK